MTARPRPHLLLDALIERADRLRNAGVRKVELDGLSFELDPPDLKPAADMADEAGEDSWDDPSQYGGRDGFVPGFPRLRERRRGMEPEE